MEKSPWNFIYQSGLIPQNVATGTFKCGEVQGQDIGNKFYLLNTNNYEKCK